MLNKLARRDRACLVVRLPRRDLPRNVPIITTLPLGCKNRYAPESVCRRRACSKAIRACECEGPVPPRSLRTERGARVHQSSHPGKSCKVRQNGVFAEKNRVIFARCAQMAENGVAFFPTMWFRRDSRYELQSSRRGNFEF
jgi:hypothetical protein